MGQLCHFTSSIDQNFCATTIWTKLLVDVTLVPLPSPIYRILRVCHLREWVRENFALQKGPLLKFCLTKGCRCGQESALQQGPFQPKIKVSPLKMSYQRTCGFVAPSPRDTSISILHDVFYPCKKNLRNFPNFKFTPCWQWPLTWDKIMRFSARWPAFNLKTSIISF